MKLPILTTSLLLATASMTPLTADTPQDNQECSKELFISFFPKPFVSETLKNYNVPQDQADAITSELASKDAEVIRIVEDKASKMDPNPLKDHNLRTQAVQLFKDALLNIFSTVVKAHGITDDAQIQKMLDEIQQQKAKRFAECMKKQQMPLENTAQPQKS